MAVLRAREARCGVRGELGGGLGLVRHFAELGSLMQLSEWSSYQYLLATIGQGFQEQHAHGIKVPQLFWLDFAQVLAARRSHPMILRSSSACSDFPVGFRALVD